MRHTTPADPKPSPAATQARLVLWTAIAALAATALLGIAAQTTMARETADTQSMAPALRFEQHSRALTPFITPNPGDPSVPRSSDVFANPRSARGIEAEPSTF